MPENGSEKQMDAQSGEASESVPSPPPEVGEESKGAGKQAQHGWDRWIGGLVWLVVLVIFAYVRFFEGNADVLLNVSGTDPVVAAGTVTYEGEPVSSGTLQVLIEDPRDGRHLASEVTEVKTGAFRVEFKDPQVAGEPKRELRVAARYFGRTSAKDGKSIKGTASLYVNLTPPWNIGWGAILILLPILVLVVLFTGPLPPRKARLLFGVTYVVTFSACVIPIVLTVSASQSRYLLETMESAPVGILKAKAKGLDQPQWLVNIGGAVTKERPSAQPTASESSNQPPVASAEGQGAAPPASTQAGENPASGAGATVPTTTKAAALPVSEIEPAAAEVRGGLAIPLYVLILAMLGAAINMTRKVPEIQADYDSNATATLTGALTAPIAILGMASDGSQEGPPATKDPSAIRKELIETYMYFLSAPFLAVAVYYLLQVIASSVAEPILVIISFASGLMSNTTVGAIMAFADKVLARAKEQQPAGGGVTG